MRYWRNLYRPSRLIVYNSPRGTTLADAGTSLNMTISTASLSCHPWISDLTASTHFLQSDLTKISKKSFGHASSCLGTNVSLFPSTSNITISSTLNFRFSTVRSLSLHVFTELSSTHRTFAIPLASIDSTAPKHRSGYIFEKDPVSSSKIVGEADTRSPTLAIFFPFPFRFLGLLLAGLTIALV